MKQLTETLTRLAELQEKKDELNRELKRLNVEIGGVEIAAIELLTESGMDQGVPVAGRSWTWKEAPQVSVLAENREAVMKAAESVGLNLTQMNTAALKAWLIERAKEADLPPGASYTEGTPFEGLVSEFVPVKLYSRKKS